MTKIRLDTKFVGGPAFAIEPYVKPLYDQPGRRILGVVELVHVERTQPAPQSENEPSVKVRISTLELATPEQEGALREAQRALHLQRTAQGTLTEDGEIELTESTLRLTAGLLTEIEAARLRAGLSHHATAARQIATTPKQLSASELRHEFKALADGLTALLNRARPDS